MKTPEEIKNAEKARRYRKVRGDRKYNTFKQKGGMHPNKKRVLIDKLREKDLEEDINEAQ